LGLHRPRHEYAYERGDSRIKTRIPFRAPAHLALRESIHDGLPLLPLCDLHGILDKRVDRDEGESRRAFPLVVRDMTRGGKSSADPDPRLRYPRTTTSVGKEKSKKASS